MVVSPRPFVSFVSPGVCLLSVSASLAVDLYPLALHVSMCDPAGRPGGRERLVLTSHHVHVRDMLADVLDSSRLQGMSRGLSMTAATSPQEVGLVFLLSLFVNDVFGCIAYSKSCTHLVSHASSGVCAQYCRAVKVPIPVADSRAAG